MKDVPIQELFDGVEEDDGFDHPSTEEEPEEEEVEINPQQKIERCPRCGTSLFFGECLACGWF